MVSNRASLQCMVLRLSGLNPCFNGIWSLTLVISQTDITISSGLNPCFNGRGSLTEVQKETSSHRGRQVLILVLMEEGLRPLFIKVREVVSITCLNPCFNGIWSLTPFLLNPISQTQFCLNPCFNGRWSLTLIFHNLLIFSMSRNLISQILTGF